MRFRFVEEHIGAFPRERLCQVMNVSPRGLRAFRSRPASRRQHTDMVVLAHIKEQSRLSLGSYGRPRMTEELKEVGVNVGHRRVGRLPLGRLLRNRLPGSGCARTGSSLKGHVNSRRPPTATTRSTSRRTCWIVSSRQIDQTRNGRAILVTSGPVRGSCIWR